MAKLETKIYDARISDLTETEHNPRQISKKDFAKLKKSLKEFPEMLDIREVVIDEIESYNDSPAELIYDDFEALLFPGHPLGRNILGDAGRLRQYTSADLLDFVRRTYGPHRAVLFVKGKVTVEEIIRIADSPPALPKGRE